MPDFVKRFGVSDGAGGYVLTSGRQSEITSLLSAGGHFCIGLPVILALADALQQVLSSALWLKPSLPIALDERDLYSDGALFSQCTFDRVRNSLEVEG